MTQPDRTALLDPALSGETAHSSDPSVRLTRWLAVGSLVGLIALGLAWELVLAPVRPGGSLLALKVLPLCIPLAGLLKNRMYTYRWLSLLAACALHVRLRLRNARQAQAPAQS